MIPSEVMSFLNRIESTLPVDKWEVDHVSIWPIVRMTLGYSLARQSSPSTPPRPQGRLVTNPLKRFITEQAARRADRDKNINFFGVVDVLFLSYTIDRLRLGESYYNRFCDPFVDELEKRGLTSLLLEQAGSQNYLHPRYRPSHFIETSLDHARIKARLKAIFGARPSAHLDGYNSFLNSLQQQGVDTQSLTPSILLSRVARIRQMQKFFEQIILKTEPRLVMIADVNSDEGRALVLAARSYGIPSVDIQHGLAGRHHSAYGSFLRVPKGGWKILPPLYWTWSEEDANAIHEWSDPIGSPHQAIAGGNMWLYQWLKSDRDIFQTECAAIQTLIQRYGRKTHVLVTLQHDLPPLEILEMIRSSPDSIFWWIRSHPTKTDMQNHLKDFFRLNLHKTVSVSEASSLPLYGLLKSVDLHLTAYSATITEAEAFGVPSLFFDAQGTELFQGPIDRKMAYFTPTPQIVMARLLEIQPFLSKKRTSTFAPDSHKAFQQLLSATEDKSKEWK